VEDCNWETIFYENYRSLFDHCDIVGLQSYRIRWKTQNCYGPFKVIQGHRGRYTNREPVCDFLLVIRPITDILSLAVSELGLYCSNFWTLRFWATVWGLGTTYDVHLGLIGKRLPIGVNWTFFPRCYCWGATSENRLKIRRLRSNAVSLIQNFRQKGSPARPHQPFFFFQKTRLNDLLCGINIWTDFSSVLSQSTHLTDGRTQRHLSRDYTALHSMQRGNASDLSMAFAQATNTVLVTSIILLNSTISYGTQRRLSSSQSKCSSAYVRLNFFLRKHSCCS